MASHSANLLLENLVVETGFEFTLARRCGSDIHSCLSTSQDDIIFLWGDGGAVQGGVCRVSFHDFKVVNIDEL